MMLSKDMRARNDIFSHATQDIFKQCSDTLDIFFDHMVEGRMSPTWFSIDFHPGNEKLVNVVAMGNHKVGQTLIADNGDEIYIDEENVNNYAIVMRFMVPLKFIESGDVDAMVLFMEEFGELATKIPELEIESLVADNNFLKDVFTAFSDDELAKDNVEKYKGFDMSGLSLEQIQQLKLCKTEGET